MSLALVKSKKDRKVVTFGSGWFGKLGVPLGKYEAPTGSILGGSDGKCKYHSSFHEWSGSMLKVVSTK